MARTKASVGAKIASGKSNKARCSAAPVPSSAGSAGSSEKGSKSYSGGNPVCPRETPKWQKPITQFFYGKPSTGSSDDENLAGPSKRKDNGIEANDSVQENVLNDSIQSNDEQKQSKPSKNRAVPDEDLNITVKSRPRKNIIESDDEEQTEIDKQLEREKESDEDNESDVPKNQVLDESIILEPLTGENSHKIEEYYLYKNKGKGKKSVANKENVDVNKNGGKRCLEEVDDTDHATKKIKVASVA